MKQNWQNMYILIFRKITDKVMWQACRTAYNQNALAQIKVAKVIRQEMIKQESTSNE